MSTSQSFSVTTYLVEGHRESVSCSSTHEAGNMGAGIKPITLEDQSQSDLHVGVREQSQSMSLEQLWVKCLAQRPSSHSASYKICSIELPVTET